MTHLTGIMKDFQSDVETNFGTSCMIQDGTIRMVQRLQES